VDHWIRAESVLYLSATISTLWMAFRILKDPCTFDAFFYQDRDDIRRSGPD
jgi:hypothetical protein